MDLSGRLVLCPVQNISDIFWSYCAFEQCHPPMCAAIIAVVNWIGIVLSCVMAVGLRLP